MKPETRVNKLNELLGITKVVEQIKTKATGKLVGISEEEIQKFREVQGIIYFLQAPKLFSHKVCPNCKEHFVVSRQFVAYCSFPCISESLRKQGIEWTKGKDLEALALDKQVYDGNEPIWIRKEYLENLQEVLSELSSILETMELTTESAVAEESQQEPSSSSQENEPITEQSSYQQLSSLLSQTTQQTPTSPSSSSKKTKRKITFKD